MKVGKPNAFVDLYDFVSVILSGWYSKDRSILLLSIEFNTNVLSFKLLESSIDIKENINMYLK